jgi:exopolysaccharide biosynthesis polyprenyl glycosylphosphotransferase
MSLAERESRQVQPFLRMGDAGSASGELALAGFRQADARLSRQSLGTVVVLLDVLLALVLLTIAGVVTTSTEAALTALALLGSAAFMSRSRTTTLALGGGLLDALPRVTQIAATATVLTAVATGAVGDKALSAPLLLATWLLVAGALAVSHLMGRALSRRLVAAERCLLVGPADRCHAFERSIVNEGVSGLAVVGRVETERLGHESAGLKPIESLLAAHSATRVVILCGGDPARAAQAARRARNAGARVSLAQEAMESIGAPEHVEHVGSSVLLTVSPTPTAANPLPGKRALDVAGALGAFLLLGPLMLLIAAAIRLTSRGPALFWQDRIGLDGQRFRIAKFRSMVVDAEYRKPELREANEAEGGLFKIVDDPRITRVGRLIRKTSLDELPQLINVLRGEMSLVGPRPLVCDEDALIEGWYRDRLRLKPGMTGRWQIMGSARIPMQEMVLLDQQYVASWSLWLDLRILMRTIGFVLSRRGM